MPTTAKTPAPKLEAAAAFSFLKQTRGLSSWTEDDMSRVLRIGKRDAKSAAELLAAQGYVQKGSSGEWFTTPAGYSVSQSTAPRFERASVEKTVNELRERIAAYNADRKAEWRVTDAVAFGDFMMDEPRVQPADVGIRAEPKKPPRGGKPEKREERAVLAALRARSQHIHFRPFEQWMTRRSHLDLLGPARRAR